MGVNGRRIGCMFRTDSLHITQEILGLITRIDEFKGAWRDDAHDPMQVVSGPIHLRLI